MNALIVNILWITLPITTKNGFLPGFFFPDLCKITFSRFCALLYFVKQNHVPISLIYWGFSIKALAKMRIAALLCKVKSSPWQTTGFRLPGSSPRQTQAGMTGRTGNSILYLWVLLSVRKWASSPLASR